MKLPRSFTRKSGIIVAVIAVGIVGIFIWLHAFLFSSTKFPEPEIVGSARFCEQVHDALRLLEDHDSPAFEIVSKNVGRIQESAHSGMAAWEIPPTYHMSDKTAYYSVTWCAATIAHDSFHSKLYHDYLRSNQGPVPNLVWTGRAVETVCMKHQIGVMQNIGASTFEIEYAKTQINGEYVKENETFEDYNKRDW